MSEIKQTPPKRDWTELVAKSNGTLFFLPNELQKEGEQWLVLRKEYSEQVKIMAKKELTMNIKLQSILFGMRQYLEKNGHEDVYLKDIGFESSALDEKKLVINLFDPDKRRMPTA